MSGPCVTIGPLTDLARALDQDISKKTSVNWHWIGGTFLDIGNVEDPGTAREIKTCTGIHLRQNVWESGIKSNWRLKVQTWYIISRCPRPLGRALGIVDFLGQCYAIVRRSLTT